MSIAIKGVLVGTVKQKLRFRSLRVLTRPHWLVAMMLCFVIGARGASAQTTPTLSVATSGSPSVSGGSVTFTATISSGPTGSLTFYDRGTSIGTGTISGTTAALTTSSLGVGVHIITAGWAASGNYNSVTSKAIAQAVNNSAQTTTLTVSSSSVSAGTAVTLTATVKNGATPISPGLVRFCNASAPVCEDMAVLGTAQLTSTGTAAISLRLGMGTHNISAVFVGTSSGTSTYQTNTSNTQTVVVNGSGSYVTSTTLAASGIPSSYTLTGSVTGFGSGSLGTSVSFVDNTTSTPVPLGSTPLGTASYALQGPTLYGDANSFCYDSSCLAIAQDINGDGVPDVLVSNYSKNEIFVVIGNGDGTFKTPVGYAVGTSPGSIAVGDFNGDGIPDLAVSNGQSSNVSILLGNGDGTFQTQNSFPTGSNPSGIAVGDFNGDGIADVLVVTPNGDTISVLLGNGDGTFQTPVTTSTGHAPAAVVVADFNGDGILDVAVAVDGTNSSTSELVVYLGIGNGKFQTPTTYSPAGSVSIVAGDFNQDGIPDLAYSIHGGSTVVVMIGNGNGTFQTAVSYAVGATAGSVAIGDFNQDGFADLAVPNGNGTTSILFGNGDGTFQAQISYASGGGTGAAVADLNGDGLPDVVSVNDQLSVMLDAQVATYTDTGFSFTGSVGYHNVVASFPANSTFATSQSTAVPLYSSNATPTLSLATSGTPAVYGNTLTLTATISSGPTGSVSFYSGTTLLGSATISSATATYTTAIYTTTTLAVGTYSITAQWAGNSSYNPATSNTVTQVVTQATPNLTFTPIATVTYGVAPFSVSASSASPGTITYAVTSGPATISGSTLTITGAGTVVLGASQAATTNYTAATASTTFTVNQATPTLLVTTSGTPSTSGSSVTFKATISSGPTGTITFYDRGISIGSGTISGNIAMYTTSTLAIGLHAITASWPGNTNYTAVTSHVINQAVNNPLETTTLTVSSNSVSEYTPVTLTATVMYETTAISPGLVRFCNASAPDCEDMAVLGTAQLTSAGTASIAIRLGVGTHNIYAVFMGTSTYQANTSNTQTVAVSSNGTYPSFTTLAASGTAADYTLSGVVGGYGPMPPTGTVTFSDTSNSNAQIGTAPVSGATGYALQGPTLFGDDTSYCYDSSCLAIAEDINGDGIPDVLVSNYSKDVVSVSIGKGDGTFYTPVPYATGTTPGSLAVGDFNGDGVPDLAVSNSGSSNVSVLLGNGDGSFQTQVPYATVGAASGIAVGDFNGDGIADILVVGGNSNTIAVLLGKGDGTFQTQVTTSTGHGSTAVAVADFNGDGILDVAVATDAPESSTSEIAVYLGIGNGQFQAGATYSPAGTVSIAVGDFNLDGIPDLVYSLHGGTTVAVMIGNGNGTFQTSVPYTVGTGAGGVAIGDFNQDGIPDVAVANNNGTTSILLGNGDGTFQSQISYAAGGTGAAVADLNGDGYPDVVAVTGQLSIMLDAQVTNFTESGVSFTGTEGEHKVAATYSADSVYLPSTSNVVDLTSVNTTPTLTLVSSSNPSTYGSSVTFTATISSGPTGTLAFYDGNASLDNETISGNTASYTTSTLSVGTHNITVRWNGNSTYSPVYSSAVTQVVTQGNPNLTITPIATQTFGVSPITVSATSASTGTITFGVTSGPATISGSTLTITGAGTVVLTASQVATTDYFATTTSASFIVSKATPTLSLATSGTPSTYGGSVTFTATFAGGPSGTISLNFYDGTSLLGSSTTATFSTNTLTATTHAITATWAGTANYNAVTSSPVTQVVNQANTITQLSSTPNPSPFGQNVNLQALVNTEGFVPTGTITFQDNGTSIGTGTLSQVSTTNLLPYSQQVGGTSWGPYCSSVTSNMTLDNTSVPAPDGTATATGFVMPSTVSCSGTPATLGAIATIAGGLTAGQSYTASVWLQGAAGGESVLIGLNDCATTSVYLTSSWQRYTVTFPTISSNIANCTTGARGFQVLSDYDPDITFYVWGAQVEAASSEGPYIQTAATALNGFGGVATLSTASLAVDTHPLIAVYSGDTNYITSKSAIASETITSTPVVSTVSTSSGTVGTTVTITGSNFGATQGTSTVTFNGTAAAISSWSDTQIVAIVPAGATTGSIVVDVDGIETVVGNFVVQQTPAITWATPSAISYGLALSSTQLNATASVPGTFTYSPAPGIVPNIGSNTLSLTFTPTDTVDYLSAMATVSLTVNQTAPTITWPAPAEITYGTALSSTQLNATASAPGASGTLTTLPGTFAYTPAAGTAPGAGTDTLSVTFTPTDTAHYPSVTQTTSLVVNKATPAITWATPASIVSGTALSATQLNASSTVAGNVTYAPASGTVLATGSYTLLAIFTPTDTTDYNLVTAGVTIVVTASSYAAGIITTLVGNGTIGYTGNGGPATSAEIAASVLAVDSSENVYFAATIVDSYEYIRKVSATDGSISNVAGNGTYDYSGDGGPAIGAGIGIPSGVAVDSSGNLYIADVHDSVVRKVTSPGTSSATITTVAGNGTYGYSGDGGSATSAQLDVVEGVAVDASGNIYIADNGNNRIRMVTPSGTISTVAGNGTDGYSGDGGSPTDAEIGVEVTVAVDSAGDLYLADPTNHVIRKVTAPGTPSAIITTVAGNGTSGYSGDGGSATSAQLSSPYTVAVDAAGNLYIGDTGNGRIRMVTASGTISTVAGDGTIGFSGDYGLATNADLNPNAVAADASGDFFIADFYDARIRVVGAVDLSSGAPTVSVSCSPNSITYEDLTSTCSIQTNDNATGTVSLTYNGTAWTTVTLTSGTATVTWPSTLGVGIYTIVATYSGDSNNTPASGMTTMTVLQATPVITWAAPANIITGTALSLTQLNASSSVPQGVLTYSPAAGTVLTPGNYTLSVVFTPTDTVDYAIATASTFITVKDTSGISDTGTVTLTVNNSTIATTSYGAGSTPTSVAAALAANVVSGSPVSVTAVDDTLYLQATADGTASDYSYTVQGTTSQPTIFSEPSFMYPAVSGDLEGGALQNTQGASVYSYTVPSGGYDSVGNLLNYQDGTTGPQNQTTIMGTWGFQYDTLNRVISGSSTAGPYTGQDTCWSYDAFGNRTAQDLQNTACPTLPSVPTATASYNNNNQVTWTSVNAAGNNMTYDASGDVTYDGAVNYLYDGDGRICAVRNEAIPGTYTMTGYIYDASGARVAKGTITTWSCDPSTSGFQTTNDYILGPSNEQLTEMAMDANSKMAWQHTNVFAAGTLIATYDNDGLHFYLNDPLGSRRAQTDYAGVLEQTCASLPFGDALNCSGSIQTPTEHHFTGKERDTESGNDYFGARYYGSSMGRFMSPDWSAKEEGDEPVPYAKLDNPQSLNLYTYGLNNPLTETDPDGHMSTDTYVPDLDKHGGAHIDRYNKNGQNVGRYRPDGTPMKHGTKTPAPVPNSDKGKFAEAKKELEKKQQDRQQYDDDVKNRPVVAPTPPLPDALKPCVYPCVQLPPLFDPDGHHPWGPLPPFPGPNPEPLPLPPIPIPIPLPFTYSAGSPTQPNDLHQ
jgi:RHS repeat-associated protein